MNEDNVNNTDEVVDFNSLLSEHLERFDEQFEKVPYHIVVTKTGERITTKYLTRSKGSGTGWGDQLHQAKLEWFYHFKTSPFEIMRFGADNYHMDELSMVIEPEDATTVFYGENSSARFCSDYVIDFSHYSENGLKRRWCNDKKYSWEHSVEVEPSYVRDRIVDHV